MTTSNGSARSRRGQRRQDKEEGCCAGAFDDCTSWCAMHCPQMALVLLPTLIAVLLRPAAGRRAHAD
ncbi:hypothetical protein, partial [Streptomyces sp. NPDC096030]|uniref:hypothetical protein n=1 Tax=Streptomyces sp. NPDC096030 TaxID=3155423 RepID=UPI00331A71F7